MLENQIAYSTSRYDIIRLLQKKRIYVSTISSILGKLDIFRLVEFDMAIIDEASQILEPMLVGLLPRFNRFVLVGDHKQLPAVVRQESNHTIVNDLKLRSFGFEDLKVSLFERLYLQCLDKKWTHAYDIIAHQGRMHQDIMKFVNHHFYDGQLKIIQSLPRLTSRRKLISQHQNHNALVNERMIFIDSATDSDSNWKTNKHEANYVKMLINELIKIYTYNNISLDAHTIGVITPYRAQIAMIKSYMETNISFTVDTVERYQGGARDIIIISLCTNKLSQLDSLINLSTDGVDRKLNVALTRAKEQVIIIGNKKILSQNKTYDSLINYCFEMTLT
jgi:DNA replication ATP-dependent helicase Dna2